MEEEKTSVNEQTELAAVDAEKPTGDTEKKQKEKPKKKEPRGRRRLFADYQYREVKNKKGKKVKRKVYTGKHYGFVIPKEYRKKENSFLNRIKLFYSLCWLAMTAMWVCASTVISPMGLGGDNKSIQFYYVFFPYIVGALPIMLIAFTLFEFVCTKGNRHERAFAEALKQNLKGQTIMELICSGMCAVCEAIFIIINYKVISAPIDDIFLIIFMAATAAICVFFLKLQGSLPMEEKK